MLSGGKLMKKRIVVFLICMLLIVYTIPVIANSNDINNKNDPVQPPNPGDMPEGFELPIISEYQSNPPKSFNFDHDTIVEIMHECTEILGVVSVENYCKIMNQKRRTVYEKINDGRIKHVEIVRKFPCINL